MEKPGPEYEFQDFAFAELQRLAGQNQSTINCRLQHSLGIHAAAIVPHLDLDLVALLARAQEYPTAGCLRTLPSIRFWLDAVVKAVANKVKQGLEQALHNFPIRFDRLSLDHKIHRLVEPG